MWRISTQTVLVGLALVGISVSTICQAQMRMLEAERFVRARAYANTNVEQDEEVSLSFGVFNADFNFRPRDEFGSGFSNAFQSSTLPDTIGHMLSGEARAGGGGDPEGPGTFGGIGRSSMNALFTVDSDQRYSAILNFQTDPFGLTSLEMSLTDVSSGEILFFGDQDSGIDRKQEGILVAGHQYRLLADVNSGFQPEGFPRGASGEWSLQMSVAPVGVVPESNALLIMLMGAGMAVVLRRRRAG